MKYLSLLLIILISGCSSQQVGNFILSGVFDKATKTEVSHNAASCVNIKRNCSNGNYEEWYQKNGNKSCACNN
jgi:hypothetical protein